MTRRLGFRTWAGISIAYYGLACVSLMRELGREVEVILFTLALPSIAWAVAWFVFLTARDRFREFTK